MAENTAKEYVSKAVLRFLHIPARKARFVAERIRGMSVRNALNVLAVTPRPSAVPAFRRLLLSAVSNVDRKTYSNTDDLVVSKIFVDGGPIAKRMQPHSMGRAFRIRKRSCHITLELGEN